MLPSHDSWQKASAGDIMLYEGSQIVLFHRENSWSYTRLGRAAGISLEALARELKKPAAKIRLQLLP